MDDKGLDETALLNRIYTTDPLIDWLIDHLIYGFVTLWHHVELTQRIHWLIDWAYHLWIRHIVTPCWTHTTEPLIDWLIDWAYHLWIRHIVTPCWTYTTDPLIDWLIDHLIYGFVTLWHHVELTQRIHWLIDWSSHLWIRHIVTPCCFFSHSFCLAALSLIHLFNWFSCFYCKAIGKIVIVFPLNARYKKKEGDHWKNWSTSETLRTKVCLSVVINDLMRQRCAGTEKRKKKCKKEEKRCDSPPPARGNARWSCGSLERRKKRAQAIAAVQQRETESPTSKVSQRQTA